MNPSTNDPAAGGIHRRARIEYVPVERLTPYAKNARMHSAEQLMQIADSIREFGFTNPVLIGTGDDIIAGHGRVIAAGRIGMREVPCLRLGHLSGPQKRAYVIADNKLALLASWDFDTLLSEVEDLQTLGYNIELTGFTLGEIADLQGGDTSRPAAPTLADRFMIPPFSVLNAREGWWQDRKRAWLSLGIESEVGRGAMGVNTPHQSQGMADGLVAVRDGQKKARSYGGQGINTHSPTVTQNKDGTLNYAGTKGQAARFDSQRGAARPDRKLPTIVEAAAAAGVGHAEET